MRDEVAAVGEAQRRVGLAARDAGRILAGGDAAQLLAQEPAQQGDAAVAGAQVLGRMRGDRALAHLRFVVARESRGARPRSAPTRTCRSSSSASGRCRPAARRGRRRRCESGVSSIGSTQPIDSTAPLLPRRGLGTTRSVGSAASVTRWRRLPSSSVRQLATRTPRSVVLHSTSGICAIAGTNWWPEKTPCRIGTWKLSTTFSKCCSQLHGMIVRPAAAEARVVGLEHLARRELLEDVDARQQRLAVGRAEVGEDEAVALLERIPRLAHVVLAACRRRARTAGRGSGRRPRTSSRDSSSGCLRPRRGRSRARRRDARSADGPARGGRAPSRKRIRSSPSTRTWRGVAAGVGGEADRMPVAAQQLAHRRAGADLGQLAVVRRRREPVGGALVRVIPASRPRP